MAALRRRWVWPPILPLGNPAAAAASSVAACLPACLGHSLASLLPRLSSRPVPSLPSSLPLALPARFHGLSGGRLHRCPSSARLQRTVAIDVVESRGRASPGAFPRRPGLPKTASRSSSCSIVLIDRLRLPVCRLDFPCMRALCPHAFFLCFLVVVPPEVWPAEHHNRPYLQQEASFVNPQVLALCPKAEGSYRQNTHELEEEDLILRVEAGEQGKVPFLVIRPKLQHSVNEVLRRPAVICLHSTGNSKETMRPFMEAYASLGYVAVGVDARNHGDRGRSPHAYANALVAAWKTGQEMPFLFDTVWDLIKLMDYLTGRPDIDPQRIGIMGISLGGMHTWFAAAADPRIAAAVSLIGVQSFGWAVANEQWHARVNSIPQPFEVAAQDLGKDEVDSETVAAVWQRLAPGLMDFLDSPQTIPAVAPRPHLIHNGKDDPRCPIEGLTELVLRTAERYKEAGVPEHFKFIAEEGLAHAVTEAMGDEAINWFNKYLRPESSI